MMEWQQGRRGLVEQGRAGQGRWGSSSSNTWLDKAELRQGRTGKGGEPLQGQEHGGELHKCVPKASLSDSAAIFGSMPCSHGGSAPITWLHAMQPLMPSHMSPSHMSHKQPHPCAHVIQTATWEEKHGAADLHGERAWHGRCSRGRIHQAATQLRGHLRRSAHGAEWVRHVGSATQPGVQRGTGHRAVYTWGR